MQFCTPTLGRATVLNSFILKIFAIVLFFGTKANAQVSCYSFQQSNGTYQPLTSFINVFSGNWDTAAPVSVTLPFTFIYNGISTNSIYINNNGFLTLNNNSDGYSNDSLIENNLNNVISGFGRDLMQNSGGIVIRGAIGSSPSRIFIVEWRNARRFGQSSDVINFQIRLHESSNVIEFVYGNCTTSNTNNDSGIRIGLRGASVGDFINRSGGPNTAWASTSRGDILGSSVNFKNNVRPASGLTFSWIPVSAPTSVTTINNTVCPGSATTLTAVGESRQMSTLWFEGACGNILFSEEWNSNSLLYPHAYMTVNSISGGILNVTSHTYADAQIGMENIFSTPITPSIYRNIAIRYKVNSGTADQAEIYFKKNGQSLAEDKVVRTNLISDGTWHIANFDMSSNTNWTNDGGNITGWRFDWTRGANVTMEIDYIVLTDRPLLENINANDTSISVTPTATTTYYAKKILESSCQFSSGCVSITIHRGKTFNGSSNNWNDASAWTPNGVPTISDCIYMSSGNLMVSGTNYAANASNITLSGGSITVNPSNTLSVANALNVSGTGNVVIENNASLVQHGNTNLNSGAITVRRIANPMKRYDFTYWSSPVGNQNLYNFSPYTLRDKYYSWNAVSQSWQTHLDGAVSMTNGKGYIVRAPQSFPIETVNPTNFIGNFIGVPNSGDIDIAIQGNTSTAEADYKWNLIGNPYPSAVNLNAFFVANSGLIDGTVYLWTHNSPPSDAIDGDGIYNYTSSDYAVYNTLGGTATRAASPDPLHPVVNPSPNVNVPNGLLASGQAFFIRGRDNLNVRFTNSMRLISGNNQFFRTGNNSENSSEKNRLWLNLSNTQGAFNQALIGYSEEATNGIDNAFDGELFGGNFVSIYSIIDDKKFTIQGKALPFSDEDVVPIGVSTTISGQFFISLDNFDGLFANQDIFVKDKTQNIVHNLKEGGYAFSMNPGTYNERFEIIYKNQALSNPEFSAENVVVYQKSNQIFVDAGQTNITALKIFDITGKLIFNEPNVNETQFTVENLTATHQVLLIQIATESGLVTKKIIY